MQKKRIGIAVSEGFNTSLLIQLLKNSQLAQFYTIDTLIIKKNIAATPKNIASQCCELTKKAFFSFILKLEKKIISSTTQYKLYFEPNSIESLNINTLYITPIKTHVDAVERYSEEDLYALKQKKLDLIILDHTVPLYDNLLTTCSEGIIFIDYSVEASHTQNLLIGFWSVLKQIPSSSFSIKKISPNNLCKTLLQGKVYTASLYLMNAINLLQRSHQHLHLVLEKICQPKLENPKSTQQETLETTNPQVFLKPQTPSIRQQIRYFAQISLLLCKKKWWKLQKKAMRWGVAYQFTNDWQAADLTKSIMVKNPPNHFLADPFIIEKNGAHYCYVEDLDYATNKGKITVYAVNHNAFVELGTALKEDFHLSYPFIFEVSGELFMCPETYQANEIRLYRCEQFPLKWQLHKTLKSNVSAADTNIFKWNEKWWMLTNIDSLGLDEHNSELHLFYADAFDASDWTPHPMNPIVFDPTVARNGGLLFKNNEMYRVFQQQGFDNYGEAMGIAKITALTTETYTEELLYKIPADFFKDLTGAHTYSFTKGLLVLDYKRLENIKN